MATRIIEEHDCDRCEATNVEIKTFYVQTHKLPDPAGGPGEAAGVGFDLCKDCLADLVNKLVFQPLAMSPTAIEDLKLHGVREGRTW